MRVSVMPTIYGEKIVLRLLSKDQGLLSLTRLGFSDKQYSDYYKAIMQPNGLILISGPTGSGKSTTLYATLGILNRQDNNILTIEDPRGVHTAGGDKPDAIERGDRLDFWKRPTYVSPPGSRYHYAGRDP